MNCTEVNQKIELCVLGELPKLERDRIKAHLTTCPACHATEAAYRLLVTQIKQTTQLESPRLGFTRAVRSAVKAEIQAIARRAKIRRLISTSASVAACLLLGFTIWQVWIYHVSKAGFTATKHTSVKLPVKASQSLGPPFCLQAWQHKGVRSMPRSTADGVVIRGQNMYLLKELGSRAYVAALDTKTGRQKWLSDIESCGYLVADDAHLYCLAPSIPGKFGLVALNQTDGKILWRYPQRCPDGRWSPCPPTLISKDRICWTTNKTVHMLSSANGKVLWTHPIPDGGLLSRPAVMDNKLYVANSAGLYCLDITSGQQFWRLACPDAASGWPRPLLVAADGQIYAAIGIGFGSSRLLCIEPTEHRVLWSKVVANVTHLHTAGDTIYLRNQNVQALDRTTGELIWSCQATGCSPITDADGLLYFVDSSSPGHLVALNKQTGSKVWQLDGMSSCSTFIKVNSTGYIKTNDGVVHAIVFNG